MKKRYRTYWRRFEREQLSYQRKARRREFIRWQQSEPVRWRVLARLIWKVREPKYP